MFSNSASLRSNSIGHTFWPKEEYVAGTCCTFSTADRAGRHQSESDASCSSGKFFTMVETREEAQEGLGLPAPHLDRTCYETQGYWTNAGTGLPRWDWRRKFGE